MVEAISIPKKTSSKVFDTPYKYFLMIAPERYDHDTQLHTFKEFAKTKSSFSFFHEDLTDSNFSRVSNKLEPGRKYMVRIIKVQKKVTTTYCYSYLKKRKGLIFVGAQGLSLINMQMLGSFPMNMTTFSFDHKENLGKMKGKTIIPYINRESHFPKGTDLQFSVISWEKEYLDEGDCLLCVYEI